MDLYLKIDQPRGKKFLFVDNGRIRKLRDGTRPSVILYPDRPTTVADVDAKHLLAQDPHLVTTSKPDFSKPYPTTDAEWKAKVDELEAACKEYEKDVNASEKEILRLQDIIDKLTLEVEEQKENALKAVTKAESGQAKAKVK